ncbi:MAG: DNA polymerase I [Planctomycetaceae bacterium]|nr:DNA polymerase I [Planctomycetaceae bacterium]
MPKTIYIIDTFSLLFQVFHAIPPMTGPAGQPTNAVFGFTRDLMQILKKNKPDYLLCAMDSKGPGVRNEWYEQYKANRSEMPEDMVPQIPMLTEVIEGFRVPQVGYDGWEADDVIATVARQAEVAGLDVVMVSSDKDLRQLLSDQVSLYNCRKGEYFGAEQLQEVWKIRPDQVIDFQSLVGDAVDNIPGVPLVGPKKAAALIEQFGDLETVLANAEKAPGKKLRENLVNFADQARISRKLVTLRTDLPLEFDLESARTEGIDAVRLQELFLEYGFGRFRDELHKFDSITKLEAPAFVAAPAKKKAARKPKTGRGLFDHLEDDDSETEASSDDSPAPSNTTQRSWSIVDEQAGLEELMGELATHDEICIDLETTSLNAMQADIVGWAVSCEAGVGYYIPVDGPDGQKTLDGQVVIDAFKLIMENPEIAISNQNIKYDMLIWKRHGINIAKVGMDPMVGHYLLEAGARSHGLTAIADQYLHHRMIPISDLIGKGKSQKKMFEVDIAQAAEYASEDADIALQLCSIVRDQLHAEDLWKLFEEVEQPLIAVLAEMESNGIAVNAAELNQQSELAGIRIEQLLIQLEELAGHSFNPDSPKQLREILFSELGLPVQKKTKTGASTDQSVLEKLAPMHKLPAKIIEYRQLAKLKGTYLDALPKLIHPETKRIHASFNQVVAATGRLSSSDPNLQNIPVRTEEGRQVRKAFIPGYKNWELLCCDYSQIELRVLAHFSQDEAMTQSFKTGLDIHSAVAAEVFQVDEKDVDKEMRRVAKAVNFGVIYGQSPYGLAAALDIPQEQAAEFIDNYFARYPGVEVFIEQTLEACLRTGYAYTILGRRRPIEGIKNTQGRNRNMPERTAINTVIQGSAADLIKLAMLKVHAALKDSSLQGNMLLQIHDELIFESPVEELEQLTELVRTNMEQAMDLDVPIVVDVKHGKNWLDAE